MRGVVPSLSALLTFSPEAMSCLMALISEDSQAVKRGVSASEVVARRMRGKRDLVIILGK
jgi:hypothetical protein